jgi:hypothetical protein
MVSVYWKDGTIRQISLKLLKQDLELVGTLMPEDPDGLAFCNSGVRDAFGHSPDLASVMQIVKDANTCEVEEHCEASWNAMVHIPTFRLALDKERSRLGVYMVIWYV